MTVLQPEAFHQVQKEIVYHLEQIVDLLSDIGDDASSDRNTGLLLDYVSKIEDDFIRVGVVGEFKTGKSAVINALLGEDILPTAAVPITRYITHLHYGSDRKITVVFNDSSENVEFPMERIREFQIGKPDDNNLNNNIEYISVELNIDLFKTGIRIIDTPGLSESQRLESLVMNSIKSYDYVLFVMSAMRLGSQREWELLQTLTDLGFSRDRIYILVNRMDQIPERDHDNLRNAAQKQKMFEGYPNIFFGSALEASETEDTRFDLFQEQLFHDISDSRIVFQKHVNRLSMVQNIVENATAYLDLKIESLNMDLVELERRYEDVRIQAEQINKRANDFEQNINREKERILGDVENQLRVYRQELEYRWSEDVATYFGEINNPITSLAMNSQSIERGLRSYLDDKLPPIIDNAIYLVQAPIDRLFQDFRQEFDLSRSNAEQQIDTASLVEYNSVSFIKATSQKIIGRGAFPRTLNLSQRLKTALFSDSELWTAIESKLSDSINELFADLWSHFRDIISEITSAQIKQHELAIDQRKASSVQADAELELLKTRRKDLQRLFDSLAQIIYRLDLSNYSYPENEANGILSLVGHSSWISRICWSPDGNQLASASGDGTVRLWNVNTQQALRTLSGHSGEVYSVAWSPTADLIASGGDDNSIRIWETNTGTLVRTLESHQGRVEYIAWSPDGQLLASASADSTVKIWNPNTGELLQSLQHSNWVNAVDWSPDGTSLVTGDETNSVIIWDARTGDQIRTLTGHSHWVVTVKWSHNGGWIASTSSDDTIRIWDADTGDELQVIQAHEGGGRSIDFSFDDRVLASKGRDDTLKLWRTDTWELIRTIDEPTNSSIEATPDVAFHHSRIILAGVSQNDQVISIWDFSDLVSKLDIQESTLESGDISSKDQEFIETLSLEFQSRSAPISGTPLFRITLQQTEFNKVDLVGEGSVTLSDYKQSENASIAVCLQYASRADDTFIQEVYESRKQESNQAFLALHFTPLQIEPVRESYVLDDHNKEQWDDVINSIQAGLKSIGIQEFVRVDLYCLMPSSLAFLVGRSISEMGLTEVLIYTYVRNEVPYHPVYDSQNYSDERQEAGSLDFIGISSDQRFGSITNAIPLDNGLYLVPFADNSDISIYLVSRNETSLAEAKSLPDITLCLQFTRSRDERDGFLQSIQDTEKLVSGQTNVFLGLYVVPKIDAEQYSLDVTDRALWQRIIGSIYSALERLVTLLDSVNPTVHFFNMAPIAMMMALGYEFRRSWSYRLFKFSPPTSSYIEITTPPEVSSISDVDDVFVDRVYFSLQVENDYQILGQVFDIVLVLARDPFPGSQVIETSTQVTELNIFARGDNLNILSNARYTISPVDIETIRIKAVGWKTGTGVMALDVFADSSRIDEIYISIPILLDENKTIDFPLLSSLEISDLNYSQQPDIALRIYTIPITASENTIRVYVVANSGLSYLDIEGRSLGYRDVPKQLIIEIQEIFSKVVTNGASDDKLKQIGKLIWFELLPHDLHRLYNNLSPMGNNKPDLGVRSIMLITDDEPWIPYELAVPRNKALCEEFEITRWVDGLGRTRRVNFPLGPVQIIQDADIASAIPAYDVLHWNELEGMLEARIASDYVDERIRGYHYIRSAGDLKGKSTDIAAFLSGTDFSEFLRAKAAELQAKAPLITISTHSTSTNKAVMSNDNYLEFIRSGASIVVVTWWSTDPKDDRVFYRVLYEALSQGKILGESISKARDAVHLSSDHQNAHLAYFAIGDPMAVGYQLQEGNGYLEIKPVKPIQDESLQVGKMYTFRATLRREVPAHNNGIIAKVQPWDKPPVSLHIEAPRCEVTVKPDPIHTRPAVVVWEFSLEPKTTGRSTIYADILRDDGTPFMEVHREEIEINGISNVSVTRPAKSEPSQIFVDVTDKSESYSLNNKRYPYKNIPSVRSLKRLVEDTVDSLLRPDELSSHTQRVYDILSQIMHESWWEKVDKDTSLLLIDTIYSLPWELVPRNNSHWGADFIIGHTQPNFAQISHKEYRIQQIATLLDHQFETLVTELQNEYELHCVRALDHLPPTPILNTSEALLNDICQRTRTRVIHAFAQASHNSLNIQLDAHYSLIFDRHVSEAGKSKLKGFPIIILTVQSTTDSFIDLTPYAYKLLSLGAGAVISPICTLPIEIQTQFVQSLYYHMFKTDTSNLGDVITQTRRALLETTNSLHYLGFVLFGDPTLHLKFLGELQHTTS